MNVVWKAKIRPDAEKGGLFEIRVPARQAARPLCVMKQGEDICVWFEVNPDRPLADMVLYSLGTGFGSINPSDGKLYIGSVIDGEYVWHIYW